jgi:NADP-reducing hydrogenase subunit HndB
MAASKKPIKKKPVKKSPAKKKPVVKKAVKKAVKKPAVKRTAAAKPAAKRLSIQDLAAIRDKTRALLTIRDGQGQARVTVHMGTCGIAAGARDIMDALLDEMQKNKVRDVVVTTSGCVGLCSREPMVTVELKGQPPVKYIDLTPQKIRKILVEHVVGGHVLRDYALAVGSETMY